MVIPTSFCNEVSTNPALVFVSGGYDTFIDLARQSYELAIEQTNALNNFTVTPLEFNVSFNFDGQLSPFQRPQRPNFNLAGLNFNDPGLLPDPPSFQSEPVQIDAPPTFDVAAPSLAIGAKPAAPAIVAPTAPVINEPTLPLPPDYQLPVTPTFEQLNLPSVPSIDIPTFNAVAPVFDVPDINEDWSFTPTEYSSSLLTALTAKVQAWLQGGTGLPESIERALFARAVSREDESQVRDIQVIHDSHSARGFTAPNGLSQGAVLNVIRDGANRRAALNRDLTIRFHEEELTNIRLAVTQGVALEGLLVNLHLEEQKLLLSAATFLRESALAILNARVAILNAKLSAYQTEAQVFETRIRAALANVELYRAQIEGERIRGEINEQSVRLYAEQIRAVNALVDFYKTQVEAVQAETDVNRQRVLVFQAQNDAYGKQWDAFRSQLDAYRADVDGQRARAEIYDTQARAFGTRVTAWDRQQQTRFDRERLRLQQHESDVTTWRGRLDLLIAYLQKERERISSVSQAIDAQARAYQADAAVETAASAATDRSFELGLRKEEARTNVALKQAEVKIQEALRLLDLLLRSKETQAQVVGQLSSSAMSAVNFSAGLSSSQSVGQSCSTSVSWNGEVTDLE